MPAPAESVSVSRSSAAIVDLLLICLITTFCFPFGLKALTDLDLGWHLAGGLWIAEWKQVPQLDFLAANASEWIAYSWLPEVIYAYCFKYAGLIGLVYLQFFCVWLSAIAFYFFLRALVPDAPERSVQSRICCTVATLILLQLCTPFWHLRPQLLSIVFFMFVIYWAEKSRVYLLRFAVLTCVWANCHVFWIFCPLIFLFYKAFSGSMSTSLKSGIKSLPAFALIVCAGMISPYGVRNLSPIFEYAFQNKAAYSIIQEFQPMGPDLGYVFWLFTALIAIQLPFAISELRKGSLSAILWLMLLPIEIMQRKYLPFFAILSACIFAVRIIPPICARLPLQPGTYFTPAFTHSLLSLVMLVFMFLVLSSVEIGSPLPMQTMNLFEVAKEMQSEKEESDVTVLNTFDQGGWLELAFYLNRGAKTQSSFKPAIDGRTLVMGEQRLKQYAALERTPSESCEVLATWKATYAVLPSEHPIVQDFLQHTKDRAFNYPCLSQWQLGGRTETGIWMKR